MLSTRGATKGGMMWCKYHKMRKVVLIILMAITRTARRICLECARGSGNKEGQNMPAHMYPFTAYGQP